MLTPLLRAMVFRLVTVASALIGGYTPPLYHMTPYCSSHILATSSLSALGTLTLEAMLLVVKLSFQGVNGLSGLGVVWFIGKIIHTKVYICYVSHRTLMCNKLFKSCLYIHTVFWKWKWSRTMLIRAVFSGPCWTTWEFVFEGWNPTLLCAGRTELLTLAAIPCVPFRKKWVTVSSKKKKLQKLYLP